MQSTRSSSMKIRSLAMNRAWENSGAREPARELDEQPGAEPGRARSVALTGEVDVALAGQIDVSPRVVDEGAQERGGRARRTRDGADVAQVGLVVTEVAIVDLVDRHRPHEIAAELAGVDQQVAGAILVAIQP